MRQSIVIVLGLLFMAFTGCTAICPIEDASALHVVVHLPEPCQTTDVLLTIEDRNMGLKKQFNSVTNLGDTCLQFDLSLQAGYYDCNFEATGQVSANNTYSLRAYEKGVTLADEKTVHLKAFVIRKSSDFVLAEVFFTGTQTPEGKNYVGDKYFVLVNNSQDTLYADSLVLVESKYKNTKKFVVTPDIMATDMAVDAIYRVPGDGKTFPVAPGEPFLIVDNAMDHRTMNSNSFDLSKANVEWYDVSTSATVTDIDNPDVPNMEKIYCYTLTIWVPNNQGNTTFAIGRMPSDLTAEQYLKDYRYDYDYITVTQAGTFEMSGSAYRFPNDWIIDAVNMCPHSDYEWLSVHESLDAGFAYVAETGSDKTRFGKSVRRKSSSGGLFLIDTNNSSEDFLMAQTANPHFWKK